ncbi:hypothetical protein AXE85_05725 [Gemella sp. oral taxon 928]|uniref:hypothetical protein n=1 Tax=Gemella sp. oral taxon 928 TaxID=1785995 RepID=UPI0007684C26|nr:hypothetical protein [Gemella sp. oral taxon 928]AME09685.1 hypothetical protein AXE85_05725 [Gemella sp. oral taxon 928]
MEELLSKYKKINEQIDMLNIEKQELRDQIINKMKKDEIESFESEIGKVKFKPAYFRKSFNSKEFKADNPFMYEKYIKETEVKESVDIRLQL